MTERHDGVLSPTQSTKTLNVAYKTDGITKSRFVKRRFRRTAPSARIGDISCVRATFAEAGSNPVYQGDGLAFREEPSLTDGNREIVLADLRGAYFTGLVDVSLIRGRGRCTQGFPFRGRSAEQSRSRDGV